ncbi:zinc finger, CCHC-type containing protein [Tanacetum coccineum]
MVVAAMKHMASSFAKLEKFEGMDFRRWQKKMHFMLSSMSVVYVLTTPMPEDGRENPTVEQVRKRAKWDNDDYVCRGLILNGMSDSLFDVYQNVETSKELWDTLEAKYIAEDASIIFALRSPSQDNDKPKGNNVAGPLIVNMCGKHGHLKKDCKAGNVGNKANGSGAKGSEDGCSNPLKGQSMFNKSHQIYYVTCVSEAFFVQDDDVAWWVDSGATVHVCKDRCWFKTYESLNDVSILHMGNESTALVHGRGCVDLRLNIVSDNIGSTFMSTSKLNDSILWHARLGHVHFKRMQDMSKDGLIPAFTSTKSRFGHTWAK